MDTMKVRYLCLLWTVFVVLAFPSTSSSQSIDSPWSWGITSDYGPRQVSTSKFHKGIDYGGPESATINALEGGTITGLQYESEGAGWYMFVQSETQTDRYFGYFHTFYGGQSGNKESGDFELWPDAQLKHTSGAVISAPIVLVKNGAGDFLKAFSKYDNSVVSR